MKEKARRLSANVDFEISEVENHCSEQDNPNLEAWNLLYKSLCTPEFFPSKKIRNGKYYKLLYPMSMAETNEMGRRLDLAEHALKEPDKRFSQILNEMRSVVKWSKEKHYNCSIRMVLSFLALVFLVHFFLPRGDTEKLQTQLNKVERWNGGDTTFTPEEAKANLRPYCYEDRLDNPIIYKSFLLRDIADDMENEQKTIKYSHDKEEVAQAQKGYQEKSEEYDKINATSYKVYQKELVDSFSQEIEEENALTTQNLRICIIMLLLLPFYLFSCYQYGFNISRFIHFRESMEWLSTFGSGFVTIATTAAVVVEEKECTRVTVDNNNGGFWELLFIIIGLCMLVCTSGLSLLFLTMNGIYYNFLIDPNKEETTTQDEDHNNIFKGIILRNYLKLYTTDGRDNRKTYFIFTMFNLLIFGGIAFFVNQDQLLFVALLFCMTILTTTARRLHDMEHSSKLTILCLIIPIFIILLFLIPGDKCENDYGPEQ